MKLNTFMCKSTTCLLLFHEVQKVYNNTFILGDILCESLLRANDLMKQVFNQTFYFYMINLRDPCIVLIVGVLKLEVFKRYIWLFQS